MRGPFAMPARAASRANNANHIRGFMLGLSLGVLALLAVLLLFNPSALLGQEPAKTVVQEQLQQPFPQQLLQQQEQQTPQLTPEQQVQAQKENQQALLQKRMTLEGISSMDALAANLEKVISSLVSEGDEKQKSYVVSLAKLHQSLQEFVTEKEQLEEARDQMQKRVQVAERGAAACSSSAGESGQAFYAMAAVGSPCRAARGVDYDGSVLEWGNHHRAQTAAECCAACWAHRRAAARGGLEDGKNSQVCNVWVFCGDKEKCGHQFGECWIKVQKDLPPLPAAPRGKKAFNDAWFSGVIYAPNIEEDAQTGADPKSSTKEGTLVLATKIGDISIALLPDLAPASVREIRRMARLVAMRGGHCSDCRIYRAEKNFLIQGVLRAPAGYVAVPRQPNPQQPKVMERGLVCWAGGEGGPDFFVNLVDQSGFGDSHLCWGKISDMDLVDAIVKRPIKPKAKENDMTFLQEELFFGMALV